MSGIASFDTQFRGMLSARRKAASIGRYYSEAHEDWRALNPLSEEIVELEDLLDFFEDLGRALSTDNLTDETVHHYFYTWIKGYYVVLSGYIKSGLHQEGKAAWCHFEELWSRTSVIEKRIELDAPTFLEGKRQRDFYSDEMALKADK